MTEFVTPQPYPLSGAEIGFIMDYLRMSTRDFSKLLGVTHTAVLKWEKEETQMNPGTEVCLRFLMRKRSD